MKRLILACVFLCVIPSSFAVSNSYSEMNYSQVVEDKDYTFSITGDYETVMKEVESIMKMELSVTSCTIEVTILSADKEPINVSMKSSTCYTTSKLMKEFLEATKELGYTF